MAAIRIQEENAPRYGGTFEIRLNPWSDLIGRGPILILLGAAALAATALVEEPAFVSMLQAGGAIFFALAVGLSLIGYQSATWTDFRIRVEPSKVSFPAHPSWMLETIELACADILSLDLRPDSSGLALHIETRDRVYVLPQSWLRGPWTPHALAYHLQLRWVLRAQSPDTLIAAESALLRTDRPAWGVVIEPSGTGSEARWVVHTSEEYAALAAARQVAPDHRVVVFSQVYPGLQEAFRPHPYRRIAADLDLSLRNEAVRKEAIRQSPPTDNAATPT